MHCARHILTGLSGAIAFVAVSAGAQSVEAAKELSVSGNTPQVCTLQRGQIQSGGLVNVNGLDGDTLRILQLTDPQTLSARSSSATINFAAVCNFPHRLRIESENNGLWPTDSRISSAPGGFAYAVPYEASISWGYNSGRLDADAKVRQSVEQHVLGNEPISGEVRLHIEIAEGASNVEVDAPLLAGVYSDTLRIYLEPR